ncbi:MAG: HIT family protein [Candidatus Shapirobacteria bacterium]
MNKTVCLVCDRIDLIKKNQNKYFVKELKSGYVVLADYQYFLGYTIFLSKIHTNELHKLGKEKQEIFLKEMAIVAEAVYKVFKPKKLNYELLGNTDNHLHWHLIPRYGTDPNPDTSSWVIDKAIRYDKKYQLSDMELVKTKKRLLDEIDKLINS